VALPKLGSQATAASFWLGFLEFVWRGTDKRRWGYIRAKAWVRANGIGAMRETKSEEERRLSLVLATD
jgi:hypothetical protein